MCIGISYYGLVDDGPLIQYDHYNHNTFRFDSLFLSKFPKEIAYGIEEYSRY